MEVYTTKNYVIHEMEDGMVLGVGRPRALKSNRLIKSVNKRNSQGKEILEIDREKLEVLRQKCDKISVRRWGTWRIDGLPTKKKTACTLLKNWITEDGGQRFPSFSENSFHFEESEKVFPISSKTGYYEGIATVPTYLSELIGRILDGDASAYQELAAYKDNDELKTYSERISSIYEKVNNFIPSQEVGVNSDSNLKGLTIMADASDHKKRAQLFLKASHLEAEAWFNSDYNPALLSDIYESVMAAVKCTKKSSTQYTKKKD